MGQSLLLKYVNPWKYRRDEEAARVRALRSRDGDECRRCRRPMRFDLPAGHDQGATVQQLSFEATDSAPRFDNLCLTHGRCNAKHGCDTAEVKERARVKNEAALFEKSRKRRRA